MSKATFKQRFRYRFDAFMARGGSSIFLSLVVVFAVALVLLAAFRGMVNIQAPGIAERPGDFWRQLFMVFIQLADPGTMSYDIDSSPWFKVAAVLSGIAGVVILSSLIAFITTALDQRLAQLKRGRSRVVEKNHTLILGWNERTVEIIHELCIANESEDDPVIVVLALEDKEKMDDLIHVRLPDTGNTRVVTRFGNTALPANLNIASLSTCKSVVVLARAGEAATDEEKNASDAKVIKTCLAIEACRPAGKKLTVVAELFHEKSRRVVEDISKDTFHTVDDHKILAKLIVQTSRSTGLSVVYNEILSFAGCEMYFFKAAWKGAKFSGLQYHFPDGVPIGIASADGKFVINPPIETIMKDDDEIIIVAQDDSTIDYRSEPLVTPVDRTITDKRLVRRKENTLLIGWNTRAAILIHELADYVLEGSTVDVMVANPDWSIKRPVTALNTKLAKLQINLVEKDPLNPEDLESITPYDYDTIILLSQGGTPGDGETTDSETIVTLLQLRRIFKDHPQAAAGCKIITEVLHSDNQALIAKAGVNDFIISSRLVSMLLAQISEEPRMKNVYADIFKEEGDEIYVKPAIYYTGDQAVEMRFVDLMRLAQQRGEICLGVKLTEFENDINRNFGIHLIPPKNHLYKLNPSDGLVVVATDET